jgi:8-oxo-dGTP pyrophosphatase MutT (NUDIX family)
VSTPVDVAAVRRALASAPPPRRVLLETSAAEPPIDRASAVLAPLYDGEDGATVVLTRRARHLRAHRGEVSFPGGRQEPGEDLWGTALREAWEEVRLDAAAVDCVGELDHLATVTSRSFIAPFVGVLPAPPQGLVPDPGEVDRILHVPLAELTAAGVYREEVWRRGDVERPIHFFELDGDTIWGATAAMLRNLLELVHGAAGAPDGSGVGTRTP